MSPKLCRHFGVCGGCSFLDKPYEEQVEEKARRVEELLGVKPEEVYPSPREYYYRNRMDYVVAEGPRVGLNVRGKWWEIVDLEECLLQSPESDIIRNLFREYLKVNSIEGWNRIERRGLVRFLSIIEGKFTGERMIFVVSSRYDEKLRLQGFLDLLKSEGVNVSSLILGINPEVREDARAGELRVVIGQETIKEEILGFRYNLHPNVFFQPNPYTLEFMLKEVIEMLELKGWEKVLELYSGVGTFSVVLARSALKVVAVESDPSAVEICELNLRENKIRNVEVINERAERVSLKYDVIVLDPPRSGLSYKLVKKLKKTKPKRLLYISCNPETQARDIRQLGYQIKRLVAIDQFPQTPLIETMALLEK